MTTLTPQTKNTATISNQTRSGAEITYLVSEALDRYFVGSAEDEFLITQDLTNWSNQTKN